MKQGLRLMLAGLILALVSTAAFAQGGLTSSIQGVVVDADGGVIPGATVTATNAAVAGSSTTVSTGNGTFTIPALIPGTYTVTVSLQGFKTAILNDVIVTAGNPGTIRAVLEVGGIEQTIVVEGSSQMVQTQTATVSTTVNTLMISSLPAASRSTLEFVTFMPGIQTPGGTRDSQVNGLPQSSINITLDGVSIQDNHLKTGDGFFARVSPRLDAVEEVTVTMAASGADVSGQGATQIRFVTRSGSNTFSGSSYYYYQSDGLNTNTYFNKVRGLPKGEFVQKQPGTRVGGPVYIPGLIDARGKAFFFVNYEESRTPRTITTNSNFLTAEAQAGIFRYSTATGTNAVNMLALAAANGQTATLDPTIDRLLQAIAASAQTTGTIRALEGNFVAQQLSFQQPAKGITYYPTIRMDYNVSDRHRLNGSWNWTNLLSSPDTTNSAQPFWPGFPVTGDQISDRWTLQTTLRSTFSANIVNELRVGASGGPTQFSPGLNRDMWSDPKADQGGYYLAINAAGITNAGRSAAVSGREASTRFIENNLTWLKGAHSFTMGGQYMNADVWLLTATRAPTVGFGIVTGDPASGMFNSTNFPGSSTSQRTSAQNLYSVLTGRVSSITGTGRLDPATGKYVYNGDSMQEGRLPQFDVFIQDNWKMRPNFTVSAGVRYVVQLPFHAKNAAYSTATVEDAWGISGNVPGCNASQPNSSSCNLFKPGTTPGTVPTYQNLGKGVKAYNTDWNNLAPSVGVNWTPSAGDGWLRAFLGEQGDTALSAGWSRSFERHGMSDFTGVLGSNPGITTPASRNLANGNLGVLPNLLRNGDLGPPAVCPSGTAASSCMQEGPFYPIPTTGTGSINLFDPNLQVPYSDSWTVGYQRAIGRRAAIEVRYVGTRNREQWTTYNFNETNIHENGFFNEYLLAQANLYANMAAGRGQSFAYFGSGTGTSPLPIFLAYFSGLPSSVAGDQTRYTSTNWTNTNFVNSLNLYAPAPFTMAGSGSNTGLQGSSTLRNNAITAGLPRNFFVANPDALGGANVTGYGGYTKFNGLQLTFRRRMANGLQLDTNYSAGRSWSSSRYSFRVPRVLERQVGSEGDVAHAWKGTFLYELPFGQGKRFLGNANGLVDRLVGSWNVSGTFRVQSGRFLDLGNVRVIGMTIAEAQKAFQLRRVGPDEIYTWPQDIIDNTIKAYSRDLTGYTLGAPAGRYFAPANGPDCIETINSGYGDCGVRTLVVQGPVFRTMDLSIAKDVRLTGRRNVQLRFDLLNAFDAVNFTPISGVGGSAQSSYQITGANSGRTIQVVLRFNW